MEPGIKLILSGPGLESKTAEEFETLLRELGDIASVRVVRTREALKADKQAERDAQRPKFDPEKKQLLKPLSLSDFAALIQQLGFSKKNASHIWNSIADYSLPHPGHRLNYDALPEWFTPIITDPRYAGDYREWRENSEIWALRVAQIRERHEESEVFIDIQALATAIEEGHLEKSLTKRPGDYGIGEKGYQALLMLLEHQLAAVEPALIDRPGLDD